MTLTYFSLIFDINEDVIEVYYHKNVELLYQNLIDIALKYSHCIDQSKKHYLVLKMLVTGPEGRFLFIFFSNLHPMVGIGLVELGETPSQT